MSSRALAKVFRRVEQVVRCGFALSVLVQLAGFYRLHDDQRRQTPTTKAFIQSVENHGQSHFLTPAELVFWESVKWSTLTLFCCEVLTNAIASEFEIRERRGMGDLAGGLHRVPRRT